MLAAPLPANEEENAPSTSKPSTSQLVDVTENSKTNGATASGVIDEKESQAGNELNIFHRFILYGLCGLAVEIFFTAIWEVVENGNRKLHGITSIYAMIIYGLCTLVIEWLYLRLGHLQWWSRGLIYLLWTYAWEFTTGYFLRQFNACPWDYEPYFFGHVMGLITAEYAPAWYIGTMVEEQLVIKNALLLCWKPKTMTEKKQQ